MPIKSNKQNKTNAMQRFFFIFCVFSIQFFSVSVKAESWQINLQDADVKAFINEVSNITGKDFVLDPRVNGKVTVVSHKALNKDEVYELFLSVLDVNGIIAIPNGKNGSVKLVPDTVAKQKGVRFDSDGTSTGDELVTRIVYLKNTKATEMLSVIRPMLPTQFANIQAVQSVNALVISDKAANLDKIEALVFELDGGSQDEFDLLTLQYVQPETMLELISNVAGTASGTVKNSNRLKLVADANNNRILVKGSEESRNYIKRLIKKLDVKPSRRLGGLKVFKLKYASASHVAEMLKGLLNNQSLNSANQSSTLQASAGLSGSVNNSAVVKQNSARSSSTSSSSSSTNDKGPRFSIIADETQNAIIVNAPSGLMQDINDAIEALDGRRSQVLIQAAIIEISGDNVDQLGIQWLAGGPNSGYGITNFGSGVNMTDVATAVASKSATASSSALSKISGALLGLGDITTNNKGQAKFYGAILQAIKTTSNANLLSMPSILTLDNEQANILVGQNVPFITGSTTTNSTSGTTPYQTIERKDVGINLTVVPHIGDGGTIRLEVSQEVSAVVPTANNIKSSDIITNRRFIKTMILAEDQQTIALGGLMSEDSSQSESKVPVLGDLPLLGNLFRSNNKTGTKRNLIVFLQPTILKDGQDLSRITKRRYDQLKSLQLEIDGAGNVRKLPF